MPLLTLLQNTTSLRHEAIKHFESVADQKSYGGKSRQFTAQADTVDLQSYKYQAPQVTYSVTQAGEVEKPQLEANSLNKRSRLELTSEKNIDFSITRLSGNELIEHMPRPEIQIIEAVANNGGSFQMIDLYV